MKYLLLVRHAESSLNYTNIKDFDRLLNESGILESKLMGQELVERKFTPDYIMSSGASRALETAKILSNKINYDLNEIEINNNIYHGSYENVLEIIKNLSDKYEKLMIVGHNPTMHFLSQILTGEKNEGFSTCSMCYIKFDIENWILIDSGKKQFLISPKLFK